MTNRAFVGLLAAAALLGCRNVDLPSADALGGADGGRGPSLALDFDANRVVALSAPLGFTADSLYGVPRVSVSCGQVELASWAAPPFQGPVDLSPCVPFGQPTDAGAGILDLTVVATATDPNGRRTDLPFHLTLDATLPVITTDLGDRIRPGQPLDFTLTLSEAPGALPVTTIADLPVTITPDATNPLRYHAHLDRTPALGIDALDGGAVTLDVLTDVERTVAMKAEAVAPNGNHGRLSRDVLLSRVMWDRPLPGPVYNESGVSFLPEPADVPTAIPGALVVPLSRTLSASSGFNAAVYTADSGAVTLDAPLLDGGWQGALIDEDGWILAAQIKRGAGGSAFANPLDPSAFVAVGDGGTPTFPLGVRIDHQLCSLLVTYCGGPSSTVECVDHAGNLSTTGAYALTGGANPLDGGTSDPIAARSGENLFFGGFQVCNGAGPTFAIGTADGGLTFAPDTVPYSIAGYSCTYGTLYPVIPTRDGDFVLFPNEWCSNGAGSTFSYAPSGLLIGPDTQTLGSYGVLSPAYGSAIGVLGTWGAAHDLMVLEPALSGTAINLYPPDAGAPTNATVIPGVYGYPAAQTVGGANLALPRDVIQGADGVAVLTASSSYSLSVVRLGPDLTPRWVYRYPRLSIGNTVHLYSFDPSGPLYLVDTFNSRVVALER